MKPHFERITPLIKSQLMHLLDRCPVALNHALLAERMDTIVTH
jgi:hypothetical protein